MRQSSKGHRLAWQTVGRRHDIVPSYLACGLEDILLCLFPEHKRNTVDFRSKTRHENWAGWIATAAAFRSSTFYQGFKGKVWNSIQSSTYVTASSNTFKCRHLVIYFKRREQEHELFLHKNLLCELCIHAHNIFANWSRIYPWNPNWTPL